MTLSWEEEHYVQIDIFDRALIARLFEFIHFPFRLNSFPQLHLIYCNDVLRARQREGIEKDTRVREVTPVKIFAAFLRGISTKRRR